MGLLDTAIAQTRLDAASQAISQDVPTQAKNIASFDADKQDFAAAMTADPSRSSPPATPPSSPTYRPNTTRTCRSPRPKSHPPHAANDFVTWQKIRDAEIVPIAAKPAKTSRPCLRLRPLTPRRTPRPRRGYESGRTPSIVLLIVGSLLALVLGSLVARGYHPSAER